MTDMTAETLSDAPPPAPDTGAAHPRARTDGRRYALIGYGAVLVGFLGAGIWAGTKTIESAVFATGAVSVETGIKRINHDSGGILKTIAVREADRVRAGDLLVALDPLEAEASGSVLRLRQETLRLVEARLVAEIAGREAIDFPPDLLARRDEPHIAQAIADNTAAFRASANLIETRRAAAENLVASRERQIDALTARLDALGVQLASLLDEQQAKESLVERGVEARQRTNVYARAIAETEAEMASTRASVASLEGEIAAAQGDLAAAIAGREADSSERMIEVRQEMADLAERIGVAEAQIARTELRAPIDGVIQTINVNTIGQSVAAGQEIVTLVPDEGRVEFEIQIPPEHIENVDVGDEVEIRFVTFSGRRKSFYMTSLTRVSETTVTDPTGARTYYRGAAALDFDALPADIAEKIQTGMPVQAVIKTGERTVLDTIVGPFAEVIYEGLRSE